MQLAVRDIGQVTDIQDLAGARKPVDPAVRSRSCQHKRTCPLLARQTLASLPSPRECKLWLPECCAIPPSPERRERERSMTRAWHPSTGPKWGTVGKIRVAAHQPQWYSGPPGGESGMPSPSSTGSITSSSRSALGCADRGPPTGYTSWPDPQVRSVPAVGQPGWRYLDLARRPSGPRAGVRPVHWVVVCLGRMATAMRYALSEGGPWGSP